MNLTVLWLILLVVLLIIEVMTMGLTTIWFAGGALLAAIVAGVQGPIWLQVTIFIVVSVVLLVFTRPIAMKYFNKNRAKTNVESMVGKQAIVTEEISNIKAAGHVTVDGMEWTARAEDEKAVIEEGKVVLIKAVNGVKLIVEERKEGM